MADFQDAGTVVGKAASDKALGKVHGIVSCLQDNAFGLREAKTWMLSICAGNSAKVRACRLMQHIKRLSGEIKPMYYFIITFKTRMVKVIREFRYILFSNSIDFGSLISRLRKGESPHLLPAARPKVF